MLIIPTKNTILNLDDKANIVCEVGQRLVLTTEDTPKKQHKPPRPSWKPIGDGVENKHFKSYPYEETLLQLTSNEAALYSLILKGYIHNTGYSYVDLSTYTPSQKTEFSKGYKKLKERNLVKRVKKNTYLINPCAKIHLSLFDDLFEVWNKIV